MDSFFPQFQKAINYYADWAFLPPLAGFIFGGLLLFALDKIIPHFHKLTNTEEGLPNRAISQNIRFFLAVTIHNIPEGLSVGFACGLAIALRADPVLAAAASASAPITCYRYFCTKHSPEGAAISIPMFGDGMKKWKAFLFGAFSGLVEPIFAIAALFLAQLVVVTPWLVGFLPEPCLCHSMKSCLKHDKMVIPIIRCGHS